MSDSFFGHLRDPLSHAANPPLEKEPKSLHALIRACSSGRGVSTLSVLFVDIRGLYFARRKTSLSDVAAQLNRFYEVTSRAIFRHDGTLGDTVNVAARIESEALPGKILISQETYDKVGAAFPHATRRELQLKGKSAQVIAWQIAARTAPSDS